MNKPFLPGDIEVSDPSLLSLVRTITTGDDMTFYDFDYDKAMAALKDDPRLGVRLVALTSGDGSVVWTGVGSSDLVGGRSVGARIVTRRDGVYRVGDNAFGDLLQRLRDGYLEYLREGAVPERPVPDGKVIVDFTRRGAYESDLTVAERAGERLIHVDEYAPARFRFDSARDGTTGHAGRESDDDVYFHSFVSPFGVGSRARVRVGSEAEGVYLYERALRGELDWKALLDGLRSRGLVKPGVSGKALDNLASECAAQFAWMRSEIATNPSLRDRRIVAPSALVSDGSMGRSVFDARTAPSAAHVLARYIENPHLLYSPAEYMVMRSLSSIDKDEPTGLGTVPGTGAVDIIVVGSDTIGGREPGRRATSRMETSESVDESGRRVVKAVKGVEFPFKSKEESDADYSLFKARMDEILAGIPEGTRVRLITGNSSASSDRVGVGTPRMVSRYVTERGGFAGSWDFTRRSLVPASMASKPASECDPSITAVLMEHMRDVAPVLAGRDRKVSFPYDRDMDDSPVVSFTEDDLGTPAAVVCFSDSRDYYRSGVLSLASYLAGSLPVVHVQDIRSERDQLDSLRQGAALSLAELSGEVTVGESLFRGNPRESWDLGESNNLSLAFEGTVVPSVFEIQDTPVSVDGIPFRSVYGVYAALVAREAGADRSALRALAADDGSMSRLSAAVARMGAVAPDVEERLLIQSVRLMSSADSAFALRLYELDGRDIVMPSSSGDTRLFTSPDGMGENRFGVVLAAERDRLRALAEARREREETERRETLEENARKQRLSVRVEVEGEKVVGGLPKVPSEAGGAVWLAFTNPVPVGIARPDSSKSFVIWDDDNGRDPLNREKMSAPYLGSGDDRQVNDLVFIGASNLQDVMGTGRPRARYANSVDPVGCSRVDPATGKEFVCGYGIPVKVNRDSNELMNPYGYPCSYRLDDQASDFVDSIVLTDSLARSQAIRHGMRLCVPGRAARDGRILFPLGQNFRDRIYRFDPKAGKKAWVDNPHKAPMNLRSVERYTDMLVRSEDFPLNCVPMPSDDYSYDPNPGGAGDADLRRRARFVSDLTFTCKIAAAASAALGVPLRVPLDKDGRVDFGPGVPEELRSVGEGIVDSFIGVVRKEELTRRGLPEMRKMTLLEAAGHSGTLRHTGDFMMFRPNDLAGVFGQFISDSMIQSGQPLVPLHRLDFTMRTPDGREGVFSIRDSKSTKGMTLSEINRYLSYTANDVRRFTIYATDQSLVPEFKAALRGYVERASAISVEYRIVGEGDKESRDLPLDGFVDVRPSWEYALPKSDFSDNVAHSIGRPVDVRGAVSRLDGGAGQDEYAGKVAATDGFSGWAQVRWTLANGKTSEWTTIGNGHLDIAQDIVMSLIRRDYPWELGRAVPSRAVLDMFAKSVAIEYAGDSFRKMRYSSPSVRMREDDKVVTLERAPEPASAAAPASLIPDPVGEASVAGEGVPAPVPGTEPPGIDFSVSSGGYSKRTIENANADGVDFTVALAVDFNTPGERCTAKAAGDSLISAPLPIRKDGGLDLSPKGVRSVSDAIADALPDEFLGGESCGLNIAGNGIYTLLSRKVTQDQLDEFVCKVFDDLRKRGLDISLIRTGGQTGVDEAGAVMGKVLGIPVEVHAPKGWVYRDSSNRYVEGKETFLARFDSKPYKTLRERLEPSGTSRRNSIKLN